MSIQQTISLPISYNIAPAVIGVSGTNGSGKDTISQVLVEKFGFLSINLGDQLGEELVKRGLPTDRQHKAQLSAEWRREGGLGVLVDKAFLKFNQEPGGVYKGLVVGSLRNPGEADSVHSLNGKVIWVDADAKVRYDRITSNNRQGRESEDNKTFEQFKAEEEAEMSHSGDEATLNMSAVKESADVFIDNDGDDIEAFKNDIETILIESLGLSKVEQ